MHAIYSLPRAYDFLRERRARYKCAYGGRGAGRSWSFAQALLIIGAFDRPGLRVLCAREHQKSIADSVHRLLRDQIERLGLTRLYDVTDASIEGPGGTLFLFAGLRHNIENIKSMEGIDIVWIEEAERVSENSWRTLVPTIRKADSEIWVTFNPNQEADPTYQRLVLHPPADAIVVKTSWRDNVYFPDTLRVEMAHDWAVDPEMAAHVWEGECRQYNDAQVLSGKWRVEAFTPVTAGSQAWDGPYFGADWGYARDPTALSRVWLAPGSVPGMQRLMIEHEACAVGVDMDELPDLFDSVPGSRDYVIRADAARPETNNHMRNNGFQVESAPKWQGSVEDGVGWLRSCEEIVIHPRCERAAKEALLWSYKLDPQTEDVLPILKKGHDHLFDSIRYGCAPMIRNLGSARAGLIIRRAWWRQWPTDAPPKCEFVLQFLHPAMEAGEEHHDSARTTWGVFTYGERWDEVRREFVASSDPSDVSYHCILLETWSENATFPVLRENQMQATKHYSPDWVFVPKTANAKTLFRELRKAGVPARQMDVRDNPIARMHYASVVPRQGKVWHMDRAWADALTTAVAEFPESEHVGQAKTCAMAWTWLRHRNEIAFADEKVKDEIKGPDPAPKAAYG